MERPLATSGDVGTHAMTDAHPAYINALAWVSSCPRSSRDGRAAACEAQGAAEKW